MIIRLAFFALMSLGLLGFGAVLWISTRSPSPSDATVAAGATVSVLVTTHPVRAGSLLQPNELKGKTMTSAQAGDDSTPDTADSRHALTGAMMRRSLGSGDLVRMKDVMRPGDHGFLAAVLGPGMRAVSVGVDAITGSAGLIWPGDHVDLILTQTIGDPAVPIGHRIAAEMTLRDVRVIAIDQQIMEGVAPEEKVGKELTVTLEVTAAQAERVAVATRLGRLSLAVRSADLATVEGAADTPPKITWASDVSPALGLDVAQGAHNEIHVFHGTADGKAVKF